MSLDAGQNKISYIVVTSTAAFNFPYKFWENSDLVVTILNNTTGAETPLVYSTDYIVEPTNGDPELGAVVTLNVAVDDHTVVIERIIPIASEADYKIGDGAPPEALNSDFDKATAQVQQLGDKVGRQISFPTTDADGLSYVVPSVLLRAGNVLSFDTFGNITVIELAETGTIGVNSNAGLSIAANIVSAKVDDVTMAFTVTGDLEVKDLGVTFEKLSDVIDDDTMATATSTSLATSESTKSYVDNTTAIYSKKYSGATIFGGTPISAPTSWTDLDLTLEEDGVTPTGLTGRNFVHLSLKAGSPADLSFRPKGETSNIGGSASSGLGAGTSAASISMGRISYISLITDENGIVQWDADYPGTLVEVKLLAYQALI